MKRPDEIKKGLECLDKMQFFMGQRAGRELWNEKPHDVQEQDLEQYNRDAKKVRALIQQLESDKQQLEGMLAHMNQLRDAAAGRALKMEDRVRQLEAERDAAVESMRNDPHCCYHCVNMTKRGICQSEPRADGHCFEWRGVQKEE